MPGVRRAHAADISTPAAKVIWRLDREGYCENAPTVL
jgi:hypothetical protein